MEKKHTFQYTTTNGLKERTAICQNGAEIIKIIKNSDFKKKKEKLQKSWAHLTLFTVWNVKRVIKWGDNRKHFY